jgi:hypothetical protein
MVGNILSNLIVLPDYSTAFVVTKVIGVLMEEHWVGIFVVKLTLTLLNGPGVSYHLSGKILFNQYRN